MSKLYCARTPKKGAELDFFEESIAGLPIDQRAFLVLWLFPFFIKEAESLQGKTPEIWINPAIFKEFERVPLFR